MVKTVFCDTYNFTYIKNVTLQKNLFYLKCVTKIFFQFPVMEVINCFYSLISTAKLQVKMIHFMS